FLLLRKERNCPPTAPQQEENAFTIFGKTLEELEFMFFQEREHWTVCYRTEKDLPAKSGLLNPGKPGGYHEPFPSFKKPADINGKPWSEALQEIPDSEKYRFWK
ncbi:1598_t:CDS:2, partial [Racocetra persica]